jgi:hypothetical protein
VQPVAPPPLPLPQASVEPTAPIEPETPAESPWILSVGVQAELVSAVAPDWLVVPRVWADLGPGDPGFISPRAGISVAGWSTRVPGEAGDAQLTWVSGRLEGCPLNVTGSSVLALRPCLAFDAGLLHGQGIASSGSLADTAQHSRIWLAGSALLRLQISASDMLQVRAQAGLTVPFVRPFFVFDDRAAGSEEEIHSVPSLGGSFGLGAGLDLPW